MQQTKTVKKCQRTYLHILTAIIISTISNFSFGQNYENENEVIGIGRLQVSLNCNIPIYINLDELAPYDTIKFSREKIGEKKGKFKIQTNTSLNIAPLNYWAGDSDKEKEQNINHGLVYFAPALAFKVLKYNENKFEIVVNEKTNKTVVIRTDEHHVLYQTGKPYWEMSHNSSSSDEKWFLYETWDTYLKRMYRIRIPDKLKMYDSYKGNELDKAFEYGTVVEVNGEWVKIKQLRRGLKKNEILKTVWIKWTDGRKIMIGLIEAIYY